MISRRGFLAGAFAMPVALAAIVHPLAAPRSWAWMDYTLVRDMQGTRRVGRWCARRSDGIYFTTADYLFEEDVNPGTALNLKSNLLMQLNDFLDSSCQCIPGTWCPRHEFLKPREIMESELTGEFG